LLYNTSFVLAESSVILIVACTGIPASMLRLWFLWWQSSCRACGFEHRSCECPPSEPMMRPRR
jgi:hypothetical protein